ncbi:hypothetical protein E24_00407 [Faustovirus]|nr:hypothetical protein E24_00407 [Faustovirus]AMN84306.1 hypothetical protein D5a_00406 [Faustovirus]AMN85293.1 hypothetical protein E23_00407 [Faustovirus]
MNLAKSPWVVITNEDMIDPDATKSTHIATKAVRDILIDTLFAL